MTHWTNPIIFALFIRSMIVLNTYIEPHWWKYEDWYHHSTRVETFAVSHERSEWEMEEVFTSVEWGIPIFVFSAIVVLDLSPTRTNNPNFAMFSTVRLMASLTRFVKFTYVTGEWRHSRANCNLVIGRERNLYRTPVRYRNLYHTLEIPNACAIK